MADNSEIIKCPVCGGEMVADDDYMNKVKVMVCTQPTCLFRLYPDYPPRNGDEEVCYLCGKIFIIEPNGTGIICTECRKTVLQQKDSGPKRGKKAGKKNKQPDHIRKAV